MQQEQAEAHAQQAAALKLSAPPPPSDPLSAVRDARGQEFEALTEYEDRIALFLKTLDEGELMDDEMACEMLNVVYYQGVERGERERLDALVDRLRERLPEAYAHDAHYYPDTFTNVLDRLAYHGQLSALLAAMRNAWPLVKKSGDIMDWAIGEFALSAVDFVVFDYLERNPTPDPRDPELLKPLEYFLEVDPDRLSRYIDLVTGRANRRWAMSDLVFKSRRSRDDFGDEEEEEEAPDEGRQNLLHRRLSGGESETARGAEKPQVKLGAPSASAVRTAFQTSRITVVSVFADYPRPPGSPYVRCRAGIGRSV